MAKCASCGGECIGYVCDNCIINKKVCICIQCRKYTTNIHTKICDECKHIKETIPLRTCVTCHKTMQLCNNGVPWITHNIYSSPNFMIRQNSLDSWWPNFDSFTSICKQCFTKEHAEKFTCWYCDNSFFCVNQDYILLDGSPRTQYRMMEGEQIKICEHCFGIIFKHDLERKRLDANRKFRKKNSPKCYSSNA